jgi:hypothetical protein
MNKKSNAMKKLVLTIITLAFVLTGINAQEQTAVLQGAEIKLDKDIHDYGIVVQNGDGLSHFTITNTGNEPLILSNVKSSCGCTVPKWTKEPIMPGGTTVIDVKYATNRIGPINKSVTISSNATNTPTKVIRIKGKVISANDADTAPVKKPAEGSPVAN